MGGVGTANRIGAIIVERSFSLVRLGICCVSRSRVGLPVRALNSGPCETL